MVEKSICTVAPRIYARLGLLDIFSSPTVYIERIVTKLAVRIRGFEEKPVRTELLFCDFSHTFVVFVALLRVGEENIFLGAAELEIILCDGQPQCEAQDKIGLHVLWLGTTRLLSAGWPGLGYTRPPPPDHRPATFTPC